MSVSAGDDQSILAQHVAAKAAQAGERTAPLRPLKRGNYLTMESHSLQG